MTISAQAIEVASRVLVYRDEDGDYIAHALEMDLIGTGDRPNKACKDLKNAILAQLAFCRQKDNFDALFFMAPKEYEKRWLKAAGKGVQNLSDGDMAAGT